MDIRKRDENKLSVLDCDFVYPFIDIIFYCSFSCFPLSFGFSGKIRSNGQDRSRHVNESNVISIGQIHVVAVTTNFMSRMSSTEQNNAS